MTDTAASESRLARAWREHRALTATALVGAALAIVGLVGALAGFNADAAAEKSRQLQSQIGGTAAYSHPDHTTAIVLLVVGIAGIVVLAVAGVLRVARKG